MKCFYCKREASAKEGSARGNFLKALFARGNAWDKREKYLCREHFEEGE